jgi:hypothetical protein
MNEIQDILSRMESKDDMLSFNDLVEIGLYRNSNHAQRMKRHGFIPSHCPGLPTLAFKREVVTDFVKKYSTVVIKKLEEEDKKFARKEQRELFGADKFTKVEQLVDKFKKDLVDLMNG